MGKHILVAFNIVFAVAIMVQSFYLVYDSSDLLSTDDNSGFQAPEDLGLGGGSSILFAASVPLKFTDSLREYNTLGKLPREVAQRVERKVLKELSPTRQGQPTRYLTYTPTDGFGNQVASLVTALRFAWLTKRVLVIPPILGHYEGPARGNCLNPSIVGLTNQTEIRRVYEVVLERKIAGGDYLALESVLDLGNAKKYVRIVDSREFLKITHKSVYEVPQDCCACPDTVWLPYPLQPKTDPAVSPSGLHFRTIERELGERSEDVLSLGSVYFPHVENANYLFTWVFTNIFHKVYYATHLIPYTQAITDFGRRMRDLLLGTSQAQEYGCVHMRTSDSYFQNQREEHLRFLRSTLGELTAGLSQETRMPLLVLSDLEAGSADYERLMSLLGQTFDTFRLEERLPGEILSIRKSLGFDVDIMHLEAITCAHANHFVGHRNSTFSKRIAGLHFKISRSR